MVVSKALLVLVMLATVHVEGKVTTKRPTRRPSPPTLAPTTHPSLSPTVVPTTGPTPRVEKRTMCIDDFCTVLEGYVRVPLEYESGDGEYETRPPTTEEY